ncbi:unnamed protein product [Closterium sp. NIES-53]
MTPLRSSGESGDGHVGSSGGGGGRSSSRCGALRWGVSGGGQLQLQRRHHDPLSPQQLREWYARRGGGGGSSGDRYAAVQLGVLAVDSRSCSRVRARPLRLGNFVGDASVFQVWGSRAFVHDTYADKLSAHAIPCVFLGFPNDAPGWQFYHPTSRRVFPSQDVTCCSRCCVWGAEPGGAESEGAGSGGAESGGAELAGAELAGVEPWGAEPEGVEPRGAESEGAGSGGAEPGGAEPGGAEPRGAASSGGPLSASRRLSPRPENLSPRQLGEWLVRRARLRSGAAEVGDTGDTGDGGAGVTAEAGGTGGTATAGPGGARTGGAGAVDHGVRVVGAGGAGGTGAGGTVRPRPYFVPLLQQVLGDQSSPSLTPPLLCRPPDQSQLPLQPASPIPAPSPYIEQSGGLRERREPASRPILPVHTAPRVPRSCPPPVLGTHAMALHPSSVPLRVPLLPSESSLLAIPEPGSDLVRSTSLTDLATVVTDPSFEFAAASALVAELLIFAPAYRLDYATALIAEFEPVSPPSVRGECALGMDVLEDRQEDFECLAAAVPRFASMLLAPEGDLCAPDIPTPRSYAEAITGPYSSQWQAAMDVEMASWKSTGTYVDAVPPSRANIVDSMWIFRVKRPPGSPPAFKAHYVARGFSQRQGVDYFHTFSLTPKMTNLRVLLHVAAQRDYEVHSLDFSTTFLQGSLHEEIWLRRPPSFNGGPTGGLAERREPASRPASPVRATRTSRRAPRPRPPAVPGTHQMALRPSTAPLRVPLPSPPESSRPVPPDPESDSLRAASPTITRLLATVVTDPSFESTAASALVAELVDFAARIRLDYATSLVVASESVCPPSVGGECALSIDVLEDRQEEFQCFAAALPHLVSTLLAPEGDPDAPDIPTPRSYTEAIEGTYVDDVPPLGANIVSGMWIFRVKRPPGSPPVFKARYVARGFSQRQGVDYFQTFSPTPKMTTVRVLLHVAAQRDYELHSLDFSTAFLQGSLHEEIWLRRLPGFTGSFPAGTQWSLRRPVYDLRQAPREWHDTLRTTLAALGFAPSTADPSLFLRTDTLLPPFYILVYVDDLVFATADTAGLAHVKSELQFVFP